MRTKTIKVSAIATQDQITESPGYLAYRRTWCGLEVNTACDIRIIFQRVKTIMITVWTELQENPMSRTICNFALYWFLFGFIEHDRSTCYFESWVAINSSCLNRRAALWFTSKYKYDTNKTFQRHKSSNTSITRLISTYTFKYRNASRQRWYGTLAQRLESTTRGSKLCLCGEHSILSESGTHLYDWSPKM